MRGRDTRYGRQARPRSRALGWARRGADRTASGGVAHAARPRPHGGARMKQMAQAETTIVNALTIDVEDYFQVSAFAEHILRRDWEVLPCRVEQNIDRILSLLAQ